jgi:two-component system, OmpR family, response regulator
MSRVIAIVEDDPDQRDNYRAALVSHGYEVWMFSNRPDARRAFQQKLPDLAILDIMLENEMDGGFDLCRELRSMSSDLPIIFLTARNSDIDRVSGLRLDAWDYLTKPVNLEFLVVRVNSLFRIADTLHAPDSEESRLIIGDLELNQNTMSVRWKGQPVSLTLTEFWMVEALARRPGHVKTYDAMMQVTRQSYVEKNTINGYIRRIRNKFKQIDPIQHDRTVFGIGYRWQGD